jgi:hypothetical protein
MANLTDREKAFENKFAHDEELKFKAYARRNKKLGLWAADKLGLTGEDADRYAADVIRSDFDEPGDDDVFRKVMHDFEKNAVDVDAAVLRKTMDDMLQNVMEDMAR